MKVAITGASGFVGGHLARSLAKDGHDILAFSRRPLPKIKGVRNVTWDLGNDIPQLNESVDIFIHAAAITDISVDIQSAVKVNIDGTKKAYKLANNLKARRLIYISSASVYTSLKNKRRVKESFPKAGAGDNSYAISKYASERFLIDNAKIPTIILRPHIIYGPGDTRVLYELLQKIHSNTLRLPINGNFELSVTHMGNIVDAVRFFMLQQSEGPKIYNIADKEHVISTYFIEKLLRCADPRIEIRKVGMLPAQILAVLSKATSVISGKKPLLTQNLLRQLNQDSSLNINRILGTGFIPKHTLEEGLKDITDWLAEYGGLSYYLTHAPQDTWPGVRGRYIY